MSNQDKPSILDTTSTPTHGSNKALLIPVLSACFIIAFMIFFGSESTQYAQSLREFEPHEGTFYRLEGTAHPSEIRGIYRIFELCSESDCIQAAVSPEQSINPNDTLIIEGVWKSNQLIVSKILRRCDGHSF